jgi:hypothetical protein
MRNDTLFPRLTAPERARLITLAQAEAARLRAQAIHDAWSTLFRAITWLATAGWRRRRRALSP